LSLTTRAGSGKKKCRYEPLSLCFPSFPSAFPSSLFHPCLSLLPVPSFMIVTHSFLFVGLSPLQDTANEEQYAQLLQRVRVESSRQTVLVHSELKITLFLIALHCDPYSPASYWHGVSQKKKWRPRKCRYSIICRPSSSPCGLLTHLRKLKQRVHLNSYFVHQINTLRQLTDGRHSSKCDTTATTH